MKPRSRCGSPSIAASSSRFHGARITSDGGLLAYRELDDALGLTAMAASALSEGRRGRNIRHHLCGSAAPGGLWPTGRLRRRQRCRPAGPRSGDARHRRPRGHGPAGGLDQPDGPLRDRMAGHRDEPRSTQSRLCPSPSLAPRSGCTLQPVSPRRVCSVHPCRSIVGRICFTISSAVRFAAPSIVAEPVISPRAFTAPPTIRPIGSRSPRRPRAVPVHPGPYHRPTPTHQLRGGAVRGAATPAQAEDRAFDCCVVEWHPGSARGRRTRRTPIRGPTGLGSRKGGAVTPDALMAVKPSG